MSKRSTTTKRRTRGTVARNKREFPTERRARRDLIERVGIKPHRLSTPRHTGTYWVWALSA